MKTIEVPSSSDRLEQDLTDDIWTSCLWPNDEAARLSSLVALRAEELLTMNSERSVCQLALTMQVSDLERLLAARPINEVRADLETRTLKWQLAGAFLNIAAQLEREEGRAPTRNRAAQMTAEAIARNDAHREFCKGLRVGISDKKIKEAYDRFAGSAHIAAATDTITSSDLGVRLAELPGIEQVPTIHTGFIEPTFTLASHFREVAVRNQKLMGREAREVAALNRGVSLIGRQRRPDISQFFDTGTFLSEVGAQLGAQKVFNHQ